MRARRSGSSAGCTTLTNAPRPCEIRLDFRSPRQYYPSRRIGNPIPFLIPPGG